jgi:hypothetical protein
MKFAPKLQTGIDDPIIWAVQTTNSEDSGAHGETARHIYLPHASLAGNCGFLFLDWDDGVGLGTTNPVATVTDDTGTTWTQVGYVYDSGVTHQAACFYRKNLPAGIRSLTLSFDVKAAYVGFHYGEAANIDVVSGVDVSLGGHSSGSQANYGAGWNSSAATASITPTQDGGLVLHFVCQTSGLPADMPMVTCGGKNYQMLTADSQGGSYVQYAVQDKASLIDSSTTFLTGGGSKTFLTVAVVFKRDTTKGTFPDGTTPIVRRTHWLDAKSGFNTYNKHFTTGGADTIVGSWEGETALKTISDTTNNKWQVVSDLSGFAIPTGGHQQFFECPAPLSNTNGLYATFVTTGTNPNGSGTFMLRAVDYPGGLLRDKFGTATGTQSTTSATLTGATVSPTRPGGIVFGMLCINQGTIHDCTDSTYFTENSWAPEWDSGQNMACEDNGYFHVFPTVSTTLPVTTSVNKTNDVGGANGWFSTVVSYIPRPPTLRRLAPHVRM